MAESAGVVEAASGNRRGLLASLQPILCSLRFFGADLDVGFARSKLQRCGFIALAIFMLVLIVSANVINIYVKPFKHSPATRKEWCAALRKIVRVASAILFQLAFVSIVLFQWKSLWKKVQEVEHFISVPAGFSGKLRRVLRAIFIVVLGVVKLIIQLIRTKPNLT